MWAMSENQIESGAGALVAIEPTESEEDAVAVLSGSLGLWGGDVDGMYAGLMATFAMNNGLVTEDGLRRVRSMVKFLGGLLGGKRHRAALADAGLEWCQINAYRSRSLEFRRMYDAARAMMKDTMGAAVLDTAYELATEGVEQYSARTGESLGFKKKSEKMLDRLLVMSGREFRKDGGGEAVAGGGGGGDRPAVSLTFNFGGGRQQSMGVVDVKPE